MQKRISEAELKKIENSLLKKVSKICSENNLKMYLGGGTLLGAVRHGGFIPWDDDIDVMMERTDYEKLLKILEAEPGIELLTYKNTKDYYYAFAKVVDSRTRLIEPENREIKSLGVYIDIFPIDYLPEEEKSVKKLFKRRVRYQKLLNMKTSAKPFKTSPIKAAGKMMILMATAGISPNKLASKIDGLYQQFSSGKKQVAALSGVYREKEIMPADYLKNPVKVKFEDGEYQAPGGYHEYLVKHYGEDYMELPPKAKQKKHHTNEAYWRSE